MFASCVDFASASLPSGLSGVKMEQKFCACGTKFLSVISFDAHRAKHRFRCKRDDGVIGCLVLCGCGFDAVDFSSALEHSGTCDYGLETGDSEPGTVLDAELDKNRFYIHCMCGDEFASSADYVSHRAPGKRECLSSPVFFPSAVGSGSAFSKSSLSSDKQLAAFFGDLDHKREIINKYKRFGLPVSSFFDGKHMAWYVLSKFPELIDVQGPVRPSVKTVATIFEYHFHTSVFFRFAYMSWLPNKLDWAPVVDADGNLPPVASDTSRRGSPATGDRALADALTIGDLNVCDTRAFRPMGDAPSRMRFMLPLRQRVPATSVPPGDPGAIFGWANQEKYWRAYPELMGYDRQAAFRTSGDFYPWFISSVADYDKEGVIHVSFPAIRSPFDGEEDNPSVGQLDGLSHWRNRPSVVGFKIALWVLSDMVTFVEDVYGGRHVVVEIAAREAFVDGAYVAFRGIPSRRAYFIVQRFVLWNDTNDRHGPRPESPGPGEHDEL